MRFPRLLVVLCLALAASVIGPVVPAAVAASPDVVISQVYGGGGNSGATFTHDFIELYNRGQGPVNLAGWSLQYASATGTGNFGASDIQLTPLSGTIAPGEYRLVQEAGGTTGAPLPAPDVTDLTPINMSATAGKVALVADSTSLGCNGSVGQPCSDAQLARVRDLVGYGGANFFEGAAAAPGPSNTTAVIRNGAGATDTDNNSADFIAGTPVPRNSGTTPVPPPLPTGCDAPTTQEIAAVQGAGDVTPLANQAVRIEGIVTGDFQGSNRLSGFFIQDDTPDANPGTSDGLFIFSNLAVNAGDRVRVNGTAVEFNGLTELATVQAVDVCGTGTIAPTAYDLPRPAGATFEPVESVLLTFPEALTATEHFRLGRFGEVRVSSDGRLIQPTDRVEPGAPAQALLAEAQLRQLLIDDGSNLQNPNPVPFVTPDHALRLGDTATGITGVLSFGFNEYRLQPTADITFTSANPRPLVPETVGGNVKVASFNTLNYFTTLQSQNSNARGANNAIEFERQQRKEVAAITGLGADVYGLMEVENNGTTALQSLVDALNAATAPGTYAYITPPAINAPNALGGRFGTDAIQVAIIYKPAVVTAVGPAETSTDPIHNRPPLIQTFKPTAGGLPVTVVVNHFKSKTCDDFAVGPDANTGDGQSCYNGRRIAQATALLARLTELGPPHPLIIGDLNAYTEEDPIHTIEAAGYTGLSERFVDDAARYSFVFDGFAGELDHALASKGLLAKVTGTSIWHINADEPLILDYNTEFNPPGLYAPNAYRSSDHDPLLIGLDLRGPARPRP